MSQLFVDNIKSRTGGAIGAPSGAVVTGIVTATTFDGDVSGTPYVPLPDDVDAPRMSIQILKTRR